MHDDNILFMYVRKTRYFRLQNSYPFLCSLPTMLRLKYYIGKITALLQFT